MDIKDRIASAAACLDDLASGSLSGEALIQEQIAAREHVEHLNDLAEFVPELLESLVMLVNNTRLGCSPAFIEKLCKQADEAIAKFKKE